MPYRRAVLGLVLSLGAAACVDGPGVTDDPGADGVAAAPAAIVNGSIDEGHPAVVALTYGGQAFCSGTLVAPTVVVTAAHCLHPDMTGGIPVGDMQVFFGTSVMEGGGTFVDVTDGVWNEAWYLDDPQADDDVGVLRLAEPAPVQPVAMGALPPAGTELVLVGFGITTAGGDGGGTKRVATSSIDQIAGKIFSMPVSPQGTCNGDSGGTALAVVDGVEVFVGIHTRSDCVNIMLDERVDAHLDDFILPFIGNPTCASDLQCATGCAEPDPDCPCATDGFCTVACANPVDDADCDPRCGGGDGCVEGCPVPDPDCPVCVSGDGSCGEGCGPMNDGDCADSPTVAVGAGGSGGTGVGEASGGASGEGGDTGGDGDAAAGDDGGCAVAAPAQRWGDGAWAAVVVGAGLAVRRRRRLGR